MIYVSSDLHGFPIAEYHKLLASTGFGPEDTLYIIGDVVDRGSDGVEYLLWTMREPNVHLLLGNHELMMRDCYWLFEKIDEEKINQLSEDKLYAYQAWDLNGCQPTIDGMRRLLVQDEKMIDEIFKYLFKLPLYQLVSVNDQNYLLVHAGLGNFSPDKKLDSYSIHELVWNRPDLSDSYFTNITTIMGHTPTESFSSKYKGRIIKTPTWIDIDTSAGWGGKPCILRLDDLEEFYFDQLSDSEMNPTISLK